MFYFFEHYNTILVVVFDEVATDFDDPCELFAVSLLSDCSKFDFVQCLTNIVMNCTYD